MLNKVRLLFFECKTCPHINKVVPDGKSVPRADKSIYLESEHGTCRIYLPKTRLVMVNNLEPFDKRIFPLSQQGDRWMKRDAQSEASTKVESMHVEKRQQSARTVTAETDDKTYVDLSRDESNHSEKEKSTQEEARGYLQCSCKLPTWFEINAMARTHTVDKPSVREALQGRECELCREAMSKKVKTLEEIKCWKAVSHSTHEKVMHTKFVLKSKNGKQENVWKHKACLVLCENEETDCQEDTLSPVAQHIIIKLVLCLSVQEGWRLRH